MEARRRREPHGRGRRPGRGEVDRDAEAREPGGHHGACFDRGAAGTSRSELLPRYHPGTAGAADVLTGTEAAFSNANAERLLGWKPERSWRTELR